MTRSLLAQNFPMNAKIEPVTTVSDVVSLAHDLLKYPDAVDILRHAGDRGNFTDGEKDTVDLRLIEAAERFKSPGHQWDNLNIAIALARRFVSGTISVADDAAARAFAEDRLRTFIYDQFNPGWVPVRLSEALEMIESLRACGDLDPFIEYRNMPTGKKKDKVWDDLKNWTSALAHKESWKYALANRDKSGIGLVAQIIVSFSLKRLESLERELIIFHLRNYQFSDLGRYGQSVDDLASKE